MSFSDLQYYILFVKTEKNASSLLRNMERLSEVIIQNDNITSTQFRGSNFGKVTMLLSTLIYKSYHIKKTCKKCCTSPFCTLELSIDNRKIDETGIRFPDVASSNDSKNVEERLTFLELPKQEAKVEKGTNTNKAIAVKNTTIFSFFLNSVFT